MACHCQMKVQEVQRRRLVVVVEVVRHRLGLEEVVVARVHQLLRVVVVEEEAHHRLELGEEEVVGVRHQKEPAVVVVVGVARHQKEPAVALEQEGQQVQLVVLVVLRVPAEEEVVGRVSVPSWLHRLQQLLRPSLLQGLSTD